jgi:hypothetical protein
MTPVSPLFHTHSNVEGRFTQYVTFPFRRGTSPFSKMFTLTGTSPSRLSSVPSPLLSENVWRDGTGPDRSGPAQCRQCEQSYVTSTTLWLFACNECCLSLSSEIVEKLIELVRKCEELYEMSNSDSVWKEELWGQIGEESDKLRCFYCAFWSCCHSVTTELIIINKYQNMHSVAVVEYGW